MDQEATTAVVQRYLNSLAGDVVAEPVIRTLLDRATRRLHHLCSCMLRQKYPRLARPPHNLNADEMLGAVVERLLKALRSVRPATVRQFFAMANQHIRWELNEFARGLDEQPRAVEYDVALVVAPAGGDSDWSPDCRRILKAINDLPDAEREAFELVQLQGMSHADAGQIIGVAAVTVKRRLNRSLQQLSEHLRDLQPDCAERI